ncbi:MAG TPA: Arc family DNA-binding protein [Gemmatimonadales bacterium]|jgi:plasmid stability protein|nr:Arc family DNA-binding protein [Gemmatimonadales bacterium]
MARPRTLTLKNIPDALYRRLKARAAEHRRSLNSEVLVCLERAVAAPPLAPEDRIARVQAVRERLAGLPPLTDDLLAAAKRAGRP